MLKLGFIGFGRRVASLWRRYFEPTKLCTVKAIADPALDELKEKWGEALTDCTWYTTAEEMLEKEQLDGVFIGTRCNLHTKYALLVAQYNIPLFLEKPVAISEEELAQLETILPIMNEKTVVSFPLRLTQYVQTVKDIVDRGLLGKVAQVQAYNNVNYARVYYHAWYRDDSITGGLFLQKATHDLDYINYLLGLDKPKTICAMEGKAVFKGDKPAGVKCVDCPEYLTCTESPYHLAMYDPKYAKDDYMCCFATDTGNQDNATVMMQYEDGTNVVYTQNFITRKTAGKRGARLIGYKGTVEFDFVTQTVTYIDHLSDRVDHIKIESQSSHGGGDLRLAENFIAVMKGTDVSHSPLAEGILSARMCLAARKSAQTKTFVELD